MSAEAWRRTGNDLTPRLFAWQACRFQHVRLDLCGRRGTCSVCVDVSGSLATNRDCVAGMALSAPQARFLWQAWHLQYLHRCERKLGDDEQGLIRRRGFLRGRRAAFSMSGSICVAGVALAVSA